jgi:hypothetical protein
MDIWLHLYVLSLLCFLCWCSRWFLYYKYYYCVNSLILIYVECWKILTLFAKIYGYGEPVGTRLPMWVWVWDNLLPTGGYGDGYGYWLAVMGTSLGRQNLWVLYPLTSLVLTMFIASPHLISSLLSLVIYGHDYAG